MAFLRNRAVNRLNLHSAIQALAQAGGGVFFLVFLLRAGIPIPTVLVAQAGIVLARFFIRPAILPLAIRWGVRPLLVAGTLLTALQYPLLAQVRGVDASLLGLCAVTALAEIFYWPTYNAYFAAVGDAEHRGHHIGVREALTQVAGVAAPLLGAWALAAFGPGPMFAGVAVVQALAVLPLLGAPNVAVKRSAPGVLRAARLGAVLSATDGWFDAGFIFIWQIALFATLRQSFAAYGGAMALAALAGAAFGLFLGPRIDAGHGRRAVAVSYAALALIVVFRAASLGSPWLAVAANATSALLGALLMPATSAVSNLSKASPCPMRFAIATEAGWDLGCAGGCLACATLIAAGAPLSLAILLSAPPLGLAAWLLRRHYRPRDSVAMPT